MKSIISTAGVAKIRDVCLASPITLAYLFGSQARGTADRESDIDLAVLADAGVGKVKRGKLRLTLMQEFAEALGMSIEQVDVVTLQDAPVLLEQNIIQEGRVFFARDPAVVLAYEADAARRFHHARATLERDTTLTLERILARST